MEAMAQNSAHVCTRIRLLAARSSPGCVLQAGTGVLPNPVRALKVRTARNIALQAALACLLLPFPCSQEAFAAPPGHALSQEIKGSHAGHLGSPTWVLSLVQQPGTDWLSRIVELFSPVPRKCRVMAEQHTQEECEKRNSGVLKKLKHDHPVIFNLAVAVATLMVGFYLGGGFQGGKK